VLRKPLIMTTALLLANGCASSDTPGDKHAAHADDAHGPAVHHRHGDGMPHRFEDAEAWSKQFDAPERDAWQKPDEVVAALNLPADAVVADIGAGTGYFAVRIAKVVPEGRVLGVDVEADMVRFIDERAQKEGLSNLKGRVTPFDRADIDDGTDVVLVVDTYHHISARVPYFKALRTKLSPRGRLVIIDFRMESERGPPPAHRLSPDVVRGELGEAGFVEVEAYEFLSDQYFLVFSPSPSSQAR